MRQFIVLSILPILVIILGSVGVVEGNWCNKTVMINKVRYVKMQVMVQKRKETVWCRMINYGRGCTYNAVEYQDKPEFYKVPTVIKECCSGYKQQGTECLAICSSGCENGYCREPEFCDCHDGYVVDTPFRCKPFCPSCENGNCVAPHTCDCFEGFTISSSTGDCEPYCINCENGKCVAPNDCVCNEGFSHSHNVDECKPVCQNCDHGDCTAPGECECHKGYAKAPAGGDCSSICDPPCINGYCDSPNHCTCTGGYESLNATHCGPICDRGCPHNAFCSGPNACQCPSGYSMDHENGQCEPVCDHECTNGHCIAPSTCGCNIGFKATKEANHCEPICEDCPYGSHCVAPNKCVCDPGFSTETDPLTKHLLCRPACDPPCENGNCVAPNECVCDPHFVKIVDNSTGIGKCEECNCSHGECVLNECLCDEGYVKKGPRSCEPECPEDCREGCSGPGICFSYQTTTQRDDIIADEHFTRNLSVWVETETVAPSLTPSDQEELIYSTSSSSESMESSTDLDQETSTTIDLVIFADCSRENPTDCETANIVGGSSPDTTHDRLQGDSKWYLWLIICVGVISCLLIVGLAYVRFFRTKSFNFNDSDSRMSVAYSRS